VPWRNGRSALYFVEDAYLHTYLKLKKDKEGQCYEKRAIFESNAGPIASVLAPKAGAGVVQRLSFRGNGVSVTCSTNGQYVYAAGSTGLFRSTDYGKPGSWEQVLE